MTRLSGTKTWFAVAMVLLLLLASSVLLVTDHWHKELAESKAATLREFRLLASLVGNDLQLGDYQHTQILLNDWGKSDPTIISVELRSNNGFILSEYHRAMPARAELTLEMPIEYSYTGRAKLVLSRDTTQVTDNRDTLITQLAVAFTLTAAMLITLTRLLLLYRGESVKLAERGEELGRANTALRSEVEQRRDAEQQRDRMIAVVEASPDFISMTDPGGNILYLNQGGRTMVGLGEGLVNDLRIADMHPQWATDLILGQGIPIALRDGAWRGETAVLHRSGTEVPVSQIILAHMDAQGGLLYLSTVMRDISERKRAEESLRQLNEGLESRVAQRTADLIAARNEAERANKAKSEFLSRMSHELRTPLNAILGFSQLLELDALEPMQADNVKEILHAGQHLLDLINEVLDLARIESGKFTVSMEPVLLTPLITDCISLVRPQAEARGITIITPAQGCVGYVLADRTRLKQVLLNLLSNAVKYNSSKGTISIVCMACDGTLQIRISDTGAGLSAEQQARLFVAFERLDADRSVVEGTGIGLALSKRLVQFMEGEIGVESTPGTGSTFWVRLARAAGDAADSDCAATPATQNQTSHGSSHRQWGVLCIEDNPANMRLIERILERRNDIHLMTAGTPGLGLELAQAHRPSLILLDINLPDMDGYAVLQCLRQNEATRAIPVVAISANAMPKDLARGQAAGFVDYLTKPLDVERFIEVMERILRHEDNDSSPPQKQ